MPAPAHRKGRSHWLRVPQQALTLQYSSLSGLQEAFRFIGAFIWFSFGSVRKKILTAEGIRAGPLPLF